MDKDRIEGAAKQVAGKLKVGVGKVVGDAKLKTEGQAEIAIGKAQNALGGARDALKK